MYEYTFFRFRFNLWLLLLLTIAFCSKSEAQPDFFAQYGFRNSAIHRSDVAKAIDLVNDVVNPGLGLKLRPGWSNTNTKAVPVYVVSGGGLGDREIARTLLKEHCVIISAKGIDKIKADFDGYGSTGFDYEIHQPIALILLHEMGHLYFKDTANLGLARPFSIEILSSPPSKISDTEIRADLFAVSHIRNAIKPGVPTDRFLAGTTLSLFLIKVPWNLQSQRQLKNFGGTTLNSPKLFLEANNDHPNFELRFLVMEYALHRSKASRELLMTFLQHRKAAEIKQQRTH